MPIDRVILSGNQNELKSTFMLAEALYEMFTELEGNLSFGGRETRSSVPRSKHPEICLIFLQDPTKSYSASNKKGEISFRLMQYNYKNISTLSKQTLITLGTKIKEFFGEPAKGEEKEEFKWNKGKNMVTYHDWDLGYGLNILCNTKNDGLSVVERLLEMNGHSYHPEYVNLIQSNEPAERYADSPTPKQILGQEVTPPVERPVISVRLQRAYAIIPGLTSSIPLYDVRGTNSATLVK